MRTTTTAAGSAAGCSERRRIKTLVDGTPVLSTPPPIPGTVVLDASGVLVYDSEWHPNLQAGASYNFSFVRTSGPGYWVKVGPDPTGNPAILPKTNITPDATSLALTFTIQASQSYWIELSNLGDEYNHTDYHVTVTVA